MKLPTYVRNAGPMTNAERQQRFRQLHPGYYIAMRARNKANRRAMIEANQRAAVMSMRAAVMSTIVKKLPLMLPAPVEMIEIPGMTTIGIRREREAIPR